MDIRRKAVGAATPKPFSRYSPAWKALVLHSIHLRRPRPSSYCNLPTPRFPPAYVWHFWIFELQRSSELSLSTPCFLTKLQFNGSSEAFPLPAVVVWQPSPPSPSFGASHVLFGVTSYTPCPEIPKEMASCLKAVCYRHLFVLPAWHRTLPMSHSVNV